MTLAIATTAEAVGRNGQAATATDWYRITWIS